MMRGGGDRTRGLRTRALIILLWRAGLRISEAVALAESDLDPHRGSILVRRGKGGRRREVGMDAWAWEHINRWTETRVAMPVGALLCVVGGPTASRPWSPTAARATLRHLAVVAGVRRRSAPHQLRHAHAVEMAREGVPLVVIQRQLGHANVGITSIDLEGIDRTKSSTPSITAPRQSSRRVPASGSQPFPRPASSRRATPLQAAPSASRLAWIGAVSPSLLPFD